MGRLLYPFTPFRTDSFVFYRTFNRSSPFNYVYFLSKIREKSLFTCVSNLNFNNHFCYLARQFRLARAKSNGMGLHASID